MKEKYLELTQGTSLEKSFAFTLLSVTLQYTQSYTSSVLDNISADMAVSQHLSLLLKEPTSK